MLPLVVLRAIVTPLPAALSVVIWLVDKLPADRSTKIPPLLAVRRNAPVPGFNSKEFPAAPRLAALRVIAAIIGGTGIDVGRRRTMGNGPRGCEVRAGGCQGHIAAKSNRTG